MTTYNIEANYNTCATGRVHFPEGKTWDDVDNWYIKWDKLNVLFTGDTTYHVFDLNSNTEDATDWKRPTNVTVYAEDDNGHVEYGYEIATTE
jgi:hypothetical protein